MFPVNSETNVLENSDFVADLIAKNGINKYLIEKVLAINDLEEMDLLTDELFMERYYLLLQISGHKKQKVWGEYEWVSDNANIPIYYLKALSIPLTKNELINLLDMLIDRFQNKLTSGSKSIKSFGNKVPLRFSDESGAHFNPTKVEIKFYRYGDWRFGYFGVFSAETVFHEFSHLLDANRVKYQNILAHDRMFVDWLEIVLNDFSWWINQNYKMNNHINQILLNSKALLDWNANKISFFEEDKSKLKKFEQEFEEVKKRKAQELGIRENEYPLNVILDLEKDVVINVIIETLTRYKEIGLKLPLINKTRKKIKEEGENTILDKEQLFVLSDAMNYFKISDILPQELGMIEQNKMRTILERFILDLDGLTRGVLGGSFRDDGRIQES